MGEPTGEAEGGEAAAAQPGGNADRLEGSLAQITQFAAEVGIDEAALMRLLQPPPAEKRGEESIVADPGPLAGLPTVFERGVPERRGCVRVAVWVFRRRHAIAAYMLALGVALGALLSAWPNPSIDNSTARRWFFCAQLSLFLDVVLLQPLLQLPLVDEGIFRRRRGLYGTRQARHRSSAPEEEFRMVVQCV